MKENQENTKNQRNNHATVGVLLVDKPVGKTSFSLVGALRRILGVKKIGHAGTLDPFATGVMVMLIGRDMTRLSDSFLCNDKEYVAELKLGITTDSFDCDGEVTKTSDIIPTLEQVESVIKQFQGKIDQTPPMFSAKKINGQKLYDLARQGKTVERAPVKVNVQTELLSYDYPFINLRVKCSKGTYIRSIAYDMGEILGCGAHLTNLKRTKSGSFRIEDTIDGALLFQKDIDASLIIKDKLFIPN
jgi:tRNA pseudouridine55 synthase